MKVAVTEIFCEIITGLALCLVVLAFLDWRGFITFEKLWQAAKPSLGLALLTGLLIGTYLLGTVLDSVGLVFDHLFDKFICADTPSSEQTKNFWNNVDSHVLAYRDQVWAYYFCYRNLFMLILPAVICWFGALWHRKLHGWAWLFGIILVIMGIVLLISMRTLLKLYYDITKSF